MRVLPPPRSLGSPVSMLAGGVATGSADAAPGWALPPVLALVGLTLAALACAWGLARRRAVARADRARAALSHAAARTCEEVGRDVAQVTHRLANAVAIVRTNVRWLGEEPPRDDASRAERDEVVEETLVALERIAVIAAELRRIAGEARAAGAAAPPAASEPETPGG